MVGSTTAFNSLQSIPTTPVNAYKVLSPATFYTCPAGKRAIITGKAICNSLGAAANVRLNAGGLEICRWQAAGTSSVILTTGTIFSFSIQLTAGQTLDYTQSSGTNAGMDIISVVQETA